MCMPYVSMVGFFCAFSLIRTLISRWIIIHVLAYPSGIEPKFYTHVWKALEYT